MNEINKRLVEVETILKKLDKESISKIPQEVWDYIIKNKDTNYSYEYNDKIPLSKQNLDIVTIAILTYINMKYLLNEEQKKDLQSFLRNDELIAENEKSQLYNTNDIFNNKKTSKNNSQQKQLFPVEIKKESFWKRIIKILRKKFKSN